jgi:hypothetical protein
MNPTCEDHLTPEMGCPKCWAIEKCRRGQLSCRNQPCISGSCHFRHEPYTHKPSVDCKWGSGCTVPWCGYIHPNLDGCGHQRPIIGCQNCLTVNTAKIERAKSIACRGDCKFDQNNNCYFCHGQVIL